MLGFGSGGVCCSHSISVWSSSPGRGGLVDSIPVSRSGRTWTVTSGVKYSVFEGFGVVQMVDSIE